MAHKNNQAFFASSPRGGENDGNILASPRSAVTSPSNLTERNLQKNNRQLSLQGMTLGSPTAATEQLAPTPKTQRKDKTPRSYGEINPFDPKVNVIILNGDIMPTVAAVKVPGLHPRRKIASLPGRFVTLPIPDVLEGDSLPPDEMNPAPVAVAVEIEGSAGGRTPRTKTLSSPKAGVEADNTTSDNSDVKQAGTPRFWSLLQRTTMNKSSPRDSAASTPRAVPGSNSGSSPPANDAPHVLTSPRNGGVGEEKERSKSPLRNLKITITDSNFGEESKSDSAAHENRIMDRIAVEGEENPRLAELQKQVAQRIEELEGPFASMFRLYAWANLSDKVSIPLSHLCLMFCSLFACVCWNSNHTFRCFTCSVISCLTAVPLANIQDRLTTKDRPTITYEETVTKIRNLINWVEFGSKRKYQALPIEEKRIVQPLYMKVLGLLMVHGAITTGCDMNDVMQWHGNHLGTNLPVDKLLSIPLLQT